MDHSTFRHFRTRFKEGLKDLFRRIDGQHGPIVGGDVISETIRDLQVRGRSGPTGLTPGSERCSTQATASRKGVQSSPSRRRAPMIGYSG